MADEQTDTSLGEQMNAAEAEARPYMGTSDADTADTAADDRAAAGDDDPGLRTPDTGDPDADPAIGQAPVGPLPGVAGVGPIRHG